MITLHFKGAGLNLGNFENISFGKIKEVTLKLRRYRDVPIVTLWHEIKKKETLASSFSTSNEHLWSTHILLSNDLVLLFSCCRSLESKKKKQKNNLKCKAVPMTTMMQHR